MTQFSDKISMKNVSQLISGISSVLQKLTRYFNRAAISTFSILPAAIVLPVIFPLNLNDPVSVIVPIGSSSLKCHKRPDVFA